MQGDGKEVLFDVFRDWRGEETDDVSLIRSNANRLRENEDLESKISLLPEEIETLIKKIHDLGDNSFYMDTTREIILEAIFSRVDDESKCSYLSSESFQKLYIESELSPSEFNRKYGVGTIWQTVSSTNQDGFLKGLPLKQKANILRNVGELDESLNLKSAILRFCNGPQKEQKEVLEMMFALGDVEVDFSEFVDFEDKFDFLDSQVFRDAISEYYEGLSKQEKTSFLSSLSYGDVGWNGARWLGCDSEAMKINIRAFDAIPDESKYSVVGINVLAAALEYDFIDEDSKKIDVILRMYNLNSNDAYIYDYLHEMQNGKRNRFELEPLEIESLLERAGALRDENLAQGLISCVSPEKIKDYLRGKPENISFCMNALTLEEANELLGTIDDERYKIDLLLSIQGDSDSIDKLFPHIEDEYVRAQILIAKRENDRFISLEDTHAKIENYFSIKEQFMQLSDDERVDFLCGIAISGPEDFQNQKHKDNNAIKRDLLKYIEDPAARRKVLESMEYCADPDIQEHVALVKNMMYEYVEDNLDLTPEQMELFEMELITNDVFFVENLRL